MTLYKCAGCNWLGDDPAERLMQTSSENMYDRGAEWSQELIECCPRCSGPVDAVIACDLCHERQPEAGADECSECLAAIAREPGPIIAEFACATDCAAFARTKAGHTVTAGLGLPYAVRRVS